MDIKTPVNSPNKIDAFRSAREPVIRIHSEDSPGRSISIKNGSLKTPQWMESPPPPLRAMGTLEKEAFKSSLTNEYMVCGHRVDKRFLNFIATLIVSLVVLSFCIIQLFRGDSTITPYCVGTIGSILGYFLGNHSNSNDNVIKKPN